MIHDHSYISNNIWLISHNCPIPITEGLLTFEQILDYFKFHVMHPFRATTYYLADRRYDMLPAVLSADLCSLLGGMDR